MPLPSEHHPWVGADDSENLNPEEVQFNLKQTTAEIQNSFGKLDSMSQDSGISTISCTGDGRLQESQKLSYVSK